MQRRVDDATVRHIALLSRLALNDAESAAMGGELTEIIEYMGCLAEVDTDKVPPTAHVLPVHNVFRADEVKPSLDATDATANAPQRGGSYFRVPKVLDADGGA